MNADSNKLAVKQSKFLSLVLRHKPETIGLKLDEAGWANVDDLLAACTRSQFPLTRAQLDDLVLTSDKQRFAFDESRTRIRANQGHSVSVDLGYAPAEPPAILYHGTVEKFLPSIRAEGLNKGQRHHVHLSPDEETAQKVGQRRGEAILLKVNAAQMRRDGFEFFRSENGVWLTDHVPPQYLQ